MAGLCLEVKKGYLVDYYMLREKQDEKDSLLNWEIEKHRWNISLDGDAELLVEKIVCISGAGALFQCGPA